MSATNRGAIRRERESDFYRTPEWVVDSIIQTQRKPFWDKHPVTQLYVLSERPSFTGKAATQNDLMEAVKTRIEQYKGGLK